MQADSPLLLVDLSENSNIDRVPEHLPSVSSDSNEVLSRELNHDGNRRETSLLSDDELALLLVDLTEGQIRGNGEGDLTRHKGKEKSCP